MAGENQPQAKNTRPAVPDRRGLDVVGPRRAVGLGEPAAVKPRPPDGDIAARAIAWLIGVTALAVQRIELAVDVRPRESAWNAATASQTKTACQRTHSRRPGTRPKTTIEVQLSLEGEEEGG